MRKKWLSRLYDPDKRFYMILILGILAVSGLFVLAVALPLASNPTFCGVTCHNQNPEYQSWKKSSHAAVTCYACHMDRYSPKHLLQLKLVEAPLGIIHTLTNGLEEPINKDSKYSQEHVPSDRCLRCHSPENRKFSPSKGLNITSKVHMKHLKAGLECTTCHNRVAHKGAEDFEPLKSEWPKAKGFKYKNFTTMREGCWRCHGTEAKYRNKEALLKVKNGKEPPTNCDTCHNQDWNLKPSTGDFNHNEVGGVPWRIGTKRHGVIAMKNFNACFACHPQMGSTANGLPNCSTSCHEGITMPHNISKRSNIYANRTDAPPWRSTHFKIAGQQGTTVCRRCHDPNNQSANFCQSCHHQQFVDVKPEVTTSNWRGIHFQIVIQFGTSACFKCHQPEFCVTCHTTGSKPEPGVYSKWSEPQAGNRRYSGRAPGENLKLN